jgi:phosphoglycolate phosphatase
MKARLKILLFDIDGTLLLTGGAGRIAIDIAFNELFGIDRAWGNTAPDGKTDPLIFQEIACRVLKRSLRTDELQSLQKIYLAQFRTLIDKSPRFRLMPGVENFLGKLSGHSKYVLGIQTGNFEEVAWLKLQRGNLRKYFNFGGFGSDSPERTDIVGTAMKRAQAWLNKHRADDAADPFVTFVIGDAPQDILAGKALNLRTLAVTTGRARKEDLAACRPDYVLTDLSDSDKVIEVIES